MIAAVIVAGVVACAPFSRAAIGSHELRADLEFLAQALKAGHPLTLLGVSFETVDSLARTTPAHDPGPWAYESRIRQALALVGCAHTYIKNSPLAAEYKARIAEQPWLPALFMADPAGVWLTGTEELACPPLPRRLLSINELPAETVLAHLTTYQPVDGGHAGMGPLLLRDHGPILIRRMFPGDHSFKLLLQDRDSTLRELRIEAAGSCELAAPASTGTLRDTLLHAETLLLGLAADDVACLRLGNLSYEHHQRLHEAVFARLRERGIDRLIIDLRGNSGGKPAAAFDLLSHMIEGTHAQLDIRPAGNVAPWLESKLKLLGVWFWERITPSMEFDGHKAYVSNRTPARDQQFAGTVIVLIDGYTASAACTVAAYLRHHAGAICIGQTAAGAETGSNANSFQTLRLPHSGIEIQYPLFRFRHQLGLEDRQLALVPDLEIRGSIDELLSGRDLELEAALGLLAGDGVPGRPGGRE